MSELKYWTGSAWLSLRGADGMSAYEQWQALGNTGTLQEFFEALTGPQGESGQDGADGTGVNIKGSYATEAELLAAQPTGEVGDAYLVNGDLYVWSANSSSWENVGNIQGPQGDKGDDGDAGADGLSAYAVAVQGGFNGSQAEWLASLKGDKGDDGADGAYTKVFSQAGQPTADPNAVLNFWITP